MSRKTKKPLTGELIKIYSSIGWTPISYHFKILERKGAVTMKKWRKLFVCMLTAALLLPGCSTQQTQQSAIPSPPSTEGVQSSVPSSDPAVKVDFPTRDLRVIVPYAAGGNTDLDGRMIASLAEKGTALDKLMVVTNITGANTMNAAQALLDADADGHTLLMHHTAFIASSAANTVEIKYSDLKPLIECSVQPFVLSVAAGSGFTTVEEIVDYAEANPNKLTIGYVGTGSTSHVAATVFLQAAGIYGKVNMITYSSSTDALTAQLGGELVMRVGPAADAARYVNSGDLLALAVSCKNEIACWDGVPTFQDLGSDIDYGCRQGYYVRKEVPDEICAILIDAIQEAIQTQDYADFCAGNGMEPSGLIGSDLTTTWDKDYEVIKGIFDSGVMG